MKSIRKSILKLVNLLSLVAKHSCVGFAKCVYICIAYRKAFHLLTNFGSKVVGFSNCNTNVHKMLYFLYFTTFCNQTLQFY